MLNAFQQFGSALAVAVIGTAFFELVPRHGFTTTMETMALVSGGLFLVSLASTFLLPRMPRPEGLEGGSEAVVPEQSGQPVTV